MTVNLLIVSSILTTLGGAGVVLANTDGTTVGIWVVAIGSVVSAIVTGIVAVSNAKSSNKIKEMEAANKAQIEVQKAQMEAQKLQMEMQHRLSMENKGALNEIKKAVNDNTLETVKGVAEASKAAMTAASAADQAKVRVETLQKTVEAMPIPKSETEAPEPQ